MARNKSVHKEAEVMSSAQKSNTSNLFLIYHFYNELKLVSHLHPFMNILTKLKTNISKLFTLLN